jgi:hypothetical protein
MSVCFVLVSTERIFVKDFDCVLLPLFQVISFFKSNNAKFDQNFKIITNMYIIEYISLGTSFFFEANTVGKGSLVYHFLFFKWRINSLFYKLIECLFKIACLP